ncbi:bifunctional 4-hydroxy-2-oxoglutarate aldolase/2-dehydro-3-deoxy-phosphogluconate aldolase [Brachybacterium phenoliresistens]|uniref:bifunctional 4-hydroxy-2-oxoglutarate aldolase/2-dehydro-3-deoxy-phosphogluconate aldolase n=1 Tax=Brachybacterium phenoliresistens TaxID=396014 RepID=UPI0031D6FC5D
MTTRIPIPQLTAASGLVVVVRGSDAAQYPVVIDTLAEAGVRSVELTLSTPKTLDVLPTLVERYAASVDVGVGTVTSHPQLLRALDGGARYIVTPVTDPSLVETSIASGVPILPGGLTPTELFSSWSAGASAVKVFPAGLVGPGYVKDLRGPFPDIEVVPSGGVDLEAARAWLAAGAAAVSVGGPLLGDALKGGSMTELAARARDFVAAVQDAR